MFQGVKSGVNPQDFFIFQGESPWSGNPASIIARVIVADIDKLVSSLGNFSILVSSCAICLLRSVFIFLSASDLLRFSQGVHGQGKMKFFQGQGIIREFKNLSGNLVFYFGVR